MCEPVTIGLIGLGISALTAGSQAHQAEKAEDAQYAATQDAKKKLSATPTPQPVRPRPRPKGGFGSTLLTGTGGLAAGSQNIGSSTLLGQ